MGLIINPYAFGNSALTLTYVNSAIAASASLSLPSGAAEGDLAILFEYLGSGGTSTIGAPAGWTDIAQETTLAGYKGRMAYRVLQSGDTGINTGSTADEKVTALFVYRPSKAISSVVPSTWNKQAAAGNPSPQTVAASAATVAAIVCGLAGANGGGGWGFSTASPAFDTDLSVDPGNTFARAAAKLYNSAPSDHTIDMNDQGAGNLLMSGYLAVS